MLLQRLSKKEILRIEAVGALAAAFRVKKLKEKPDRSIVTLKMAQRDYDGHMKEF